MNIKRGYHAVLSHLFSREHENGDTGSVICDSYAWSVTDTVSGVSGCSM